MLEITMTGPKPENKWAHLYVARPVSLQCVHLLRVLTTPLLYPLYRPDPHFLGWTGHLCSLECLNTSDSISKMEFAVLPMNLLPVHPD